MSYKKLIKACVLISLILFGISNVVFAAEISTGDKVEDSLLNVLIKVQKYSWPIIALIFIYALYQYYIVGSEMLEHKISGQRLMVGIALFSVILQCLPLLYAFAITAA